MKNGGFGIYMRDYFGTETSIISNRIISTSTKLATGINIYLISGFPNMAAATVANNFISVRGSGSMGIWTMMPTDLEYNGGYIGIYHNSINLADDDNSSKGVSVYSDYEDAYDIRNNTIACSTAKALVIEANTANNTFLHLNNNNYYTEGYYLIQADGVNYETLEDWQDAGYDTKSISIDPGYTSATDLHASTAGLDNAGAYVGINEDIDGDARSTSAPDIGADEFVAVTPDAGISGIDSLMPAYCSALSRVIAARLKNYGTVSVKSAVISWTMNGTPMKTMTWKGILAPGDDTTIFVDTLLFANPSVTDIVAFTTLINGSTDIDATNDSAKFTVTVSAPDAGFTYGERPGKNLAFHPDDKSIATVSWTFGDGNTSTDKEPIHAYTSNGRYLVTHTVTNTAGCTTIFSDSVTVTGTAGISPAYSTSTQVYPNPFTSGLNVKCLLPEAGGVKIQLCDVSGRVIRNQDFGSRKAGENQFTVESGDIAPGVYLLRIVQEGSSNSTRVVKLK
jgi:hypothetical protein